MSNRSILNQPAAGAALAAPDVAPKLGFVGVGWIGRHRLEVLLDNGCATCAAVADPAAEQVEKVQQLAPRVKCCTDIESLIAQDLDGVVIATPSALHARQAIQVLEAGLPVFCQKPLGRTAEETRRVVAAAHRADRLLGVDLSYRFVEGVQQMKALVQQGELGEVYAADLTFHNAYGPDKPWFYDPARSGGGCVIDLGIHLVDLALWTLDFPEVRRVTGNLFADGKPIKAPVEQVEDYATVQIDLANGTAVDLTCSWNLAAGQDAVIEAAFYGTEGGVALRNVDGSFYDFKAERFKGTRRETLAMPPDAWGGRAATHWACQLAQSKGYDPAARQYIAVAETLDAIYNR